MSFVQPSNADHPGRAPAALADGSGHGQPRRMTTGPISRAYAQAVAAGDLTPDPAQQALLPRLDQLIDDLASETPQATAGGWLGRLMGGGATAVEATRGLYLWGGVGRGKSMLMDLLMAAAPVPARRVHFHAFMQEVQAGLEDARRAGAQDAVRPVADGIAAQTRLLGFDEMQITDIADAMIVGRLFQLLFEAGVTIVTTSNRAPEDLYKDGLNRARFLPFIALIRERLDVIELASPRDHREGRAADAQVWLTPADAAARAALDAAWTSETGGAVPQPLRILVMGRVLELPAGAGRVARAGFWDLCGRPLGPADYLALSEAIDTLILDGIPRLSAANFNAARRFVTLIDTLYEARIRLIASAADVPERLYVEGEGAFEFARTVSRLNEMRAAGWGK